MDYLIKDTTLSAIAGKIREKTGTSGTISPENMPQGVDDAYDKGYQQGKEDHQPLGETYIDSNGEHYVGPYEYAHVEVPIPAGYVKPTGTIDIDKNGTHNVKDVEYANVNVPIPSGYIKPTGTLNITSNGTHNARAVEYVNVNVPIPNGYIKPTGTLNITENGEHDVAQYAKVKVETPVAPPWTEVRTDIAVATRSNWHHIAASGEYLSVPQLSASNGEAAIGTTTANSYSFTDRESNPIYIMPVNKRASSITIHNTDGKPHTCCFVGLIDRGGTFAVAFDSGKISSDTYKFVAGSITHIIITMERTDGSNFAWGYNDAQVSVEFTGVADAMDEWWDKMQSNGSRTNYKGSFGGWFGDAFYPKHNIKPIGDCQYFLMCWIADGEAIDLDARLIECGITMDFSGVTNLSYFLRENEAISKLPALNLSGCTAYNYMFYAAKKLVTIGEITANINAAWGEYSFRQCTSLEHITFSPGTIGKSIKFQHSTKLTPESIESIIYGLSDDVTGQTCSINSTAVTNLISEWGSQGWFGLVQSKTNWTITTV